MNTKLVINLREGTVEAEGDEAFVRFVYEDFKQSLNKHAVLRTELTQPIHPPAEQPLLANKVVDSKKPSARKTPSNNSGKSRAASSKPQYDPKLNLNELAKFYDRWKPQNHSEKILVFAVFLRDTLTIAPCTSDQIYTCYFTMKARTKIPEAFQQAFKNMKSRTHFIDFAAMDAIEVTIAGNNWFTEQDKKLKAAAK